MPKPILRSLLWAYPAIFLIPSFFASLNRPFGWTDWLVVPKAMLGDQPLNPGLLGWAYVFNLLHQPFIVRPTTAMLYYAGYLFFHGEFWAWYIVKWIGLFATAFLVDRLVARFEVDVWTRLVIWAMLLTHPASFVLMLFSPDGWAALSLIALMLWMLRSVPAGESPLNLNKYSDRGYAGLLLGIWITAGVKEVAVVFILTFAILAAWSSGFRPRALLRLTPIAAICALYFWRMWQIAVAKDRISFDVLLPHIRYHLNAIAPPSPLRLFALLIIVALAFTARLMLSQNESRTLRAMLLLSLSSAAAMLIFTSSVRDEAVRYVIPVVFVLAFPLAIAASRLKASWPKIALVFLIPLLSAGDNLSQVLAYQQFFDEKAEILNLVERQAPLNQVAVPSDPRDFPREYQLTMLAFFQRYRQEFYGLPNLPHVYELGRESPTQPYLAIGSNGADPRRWAKPGFHFDRAETVERGHYGFLEHLTKRFLAFDRVTGNAHGPAHDTGGPGLSDTPAFQVAYFESDQKAAPLPGNVTLETIHFRTGERKTTSVPPGGSFHASFANDENGIVRIPLGSKPGDRRLRLDGNIRMNRGSVSLGVGNDQGKDLWNTHIAATEELPDTPVLTFPAGSSYFLFFFVQQGADFDVEGFAMSPEDVVKPIRMRRYGAFSF